MRGIVRLFICLSIGRSVWSAFVDQWRERILPSVLCQTCFISKNTKTSNILMVTGSFAVLFFYEFKLWPFRLVIWGRIKMPIAPLFTFRFLGISSTFYTQYGEITLFATVSLKQNNTRICDAMSSPKSSVQLVFQKN